MGGQEPSRAEIDQAQKLANALGTDIELFGNTPAGVNFPGIDGVIKQPRRPLSLKRLERGSPLARGLRDHAATALKKAAQQGYSGIQVAILAEGHTVAQIRAAWNSPSPASFRAIFKGNTVTRIIIQGDDGLFTVLPGPPLPGVALPPERRRDQGSGGATGGTDIGSATGAEGLSD